jgi:hypothetical protein
MTAEGNDVDNNKRWLHRLNLVTTLSEWTEANLSPTHIVWDGQDRDKKRSRQGRYMKAAQYVHAHLMIGRMLYPCVSQDPYIDDPLFASEEYPNDSMQLQLRPGAYPEFQAQVRQARERVMNPRALTLIPEVTWEMVLCRIKSPQVVSRLELFSEKSNLNQSVLIGLVLRYLCVGGLDDNLHASITQSGAEAMGSHCVECFASPFNHKFATYFSMFEEDRVLGSQGNFFKAVEEHNGMLPTKFQRFEMNPPWINDVYERLVEIVDRSLSTRYDLEIIVLAPQWVVTRWIPGFSSLLRNGKNPAYASHSITPYTTVQPKTMQYIHDLSDTKLFLRTVSWIFTCSEVPNLLRDYLSLSTGTTRKKQDPNPGTLSLYHHSNTCSLGNLRP